MRTRAFLPFALLCAAPVRAHAQADVIRGRVTAEDGSPLERASVSAVSIPNNVRRSTTTDRDGRYTIAFASGDGDYWITVSALGFAPKRFEVRRLSMEGVLVGDARLERAGQLLDSVRVTSTRQRPGRETGADISGTERTVGTTAIDPGQAGNLAAMAASTPGVQVIPGADGNPDQFSVFGLGGDQSLATLNGLAFGGSEIPRDAAARATLATSPWDVSRGGFAGGQLSLSTQSGSNFSSRALSSLGTAPALQWNDRTARALGAPFASLSLGAATSGALSTDRVFYSAGYQLDRRRSDLANLLTGDPVALRLAGVLPDSVRRVRTLLSRQGVPLTAPGVPDARGSTRALLLGALDIAPPAATSGSAFNVTAALSLQGQEMPFAQVTAFPTNDARLRSAFGTVQGRHTNYLASGVLTETSLSVARGDTRLTPYSELPNGGVRVASLFDDGSSAVTGLTFGGSPMGRTATILTSAAVQNGLSWFTRDNAHRVTLTTMLRWESFAQDLTTNRWGTFRYNSLADLEAGRPATFTRTLTPRTRDGDALVGALSLGDAWGVREGLQLQYGVRLDANRFLVAPARNDALFDLLGVRNDDVPSRVYLSPRLGFAWSYGRAAQVAVADGFVRAPRATLRGGVGVFQGVSAVGSIGAALSNTGLVNGVQGLACVGDRVPTPDWAAYGRDRSTIPAECLGGGTGAVSRAPEVALFDPSFRAPRSLRANANWSGALLDSRLATTVDVTWSDTRALSGTEDLNFLPQPRFTLGAEGERPVFAPLTSIAPLTGAVSPFESRRTSAFGGVLAQRSDLRSTNAQLMVAVQPVVFSTRYSWSLAYVLSSTRDDVRGFVSTAADPRRIERARSALDARHQLQYSVSVNLFDWIPVSWNGSFRSGRPFTPLVGSDINGDGFANDRAFVPSENAGDLPTATAMRDLLASASPETRRCLRNQQGRVAARSSCVGPWSSTSTLTLALNPVKFRLPQRANVSLFVNNPLAAIDGLLHGERERRGWGQSPAPDATLLYVRGFDPAARRFRYEVNPRFGASDPNRTTTRNPVTVTAQLRVDIGYTRERQLLTQSLDRGRTRGGARASAPEIRAMGNALVPTNPMALLLQQADTLALTRMQADSLGALNRRYTVAFDTIWTPVGRYLAALPPSYDRDDAYERYRRAREATIDVLLDIVPAARALLTAEQRRRLPSQAVASLDARYLASVRSGSAGGANMGVMAMLAQMGWSGGTVDASAGTVMLHR